MFDPKIGMVPPMGWNSWNTFSWNINEELIRTTADTMVESGLLEAGYEYLVIDDCWSLRKRGEHGELVPDPEKFPNGMKAVADYVHSKGLKFGMYSCCGTHTCAGYPGSFEHEFEDAEQFASWGVDFLKYDNCFKPGHIDDPTLYRRMSTALRNCGRDILFSACNWGTEDVWNWIRSSGAQMFRSTGDIQDSWKSMSDIALSQMDKQPFSGTYCHNDMDMLIVGMHGKSDNDFIAVGGCTDVEYKTHFSLWALMNSPLMIGCDIRSMTEETKQILTNRDVIAINQDVECRSPYKVQCFGWSEKLFVLAKPLANGDYAIGMFNFGDKRAEAAFGFWDIGIPAASGRGLEFYDCWEHQSLGVETERHAVEIDPHDCKIYRCKVVKVR